ncbi:hypothetical protein [Clostridium sporogenes]|uniref:hypothetical protein n=1 Tax=Clostridium sporogenes TaxID=1509 RepID=UPI0022376D52|nr:hypothetical protein [Clostridium sporogenes]MCW6109098.1 hypothetical protein [Clostridium sporogenes]
MKLCKKCNLPDSLVIREDGLALPSLKVELDNEGICNLCKDYEKSPYIPETEHHFFLDILAKTKGTKPYDAIIGISGGKDGCYVAYDLLRKYDLKILMISNQDFQTQEATIKCDEFAEKLQKKYPKNVTYLPFRREDTTPITKFMFKKSFMTNGVPCSWCTIQGLLNFVTYPYLYQCAPLLIFGADPEQIYMYKHSGSQNPWMTFIRRHEFGKFEDYQQEMIDKLSKEIAVFFNNDKEKMERVLFLNNPVDINDKESPYYKNSNKMLNYFIEKGINDKSKKKYLLNAIQEITFDNNKSQYNLPYFAYHGYDEEIIRETLKNDLNYIAPPTHSDCCMHGVIDYIFNQEHLLPLSVKLAEKATKVRMGKISKEEVKSIILNRHEKIPYPSNKDMKNFCEFLNITKEEFNNTIESLREPLRKYMP